MSVTSQTANFAYPTGSDVNDTTHVAESAPPTSGSGTATGESQGFYATNTDGSAETAYVICGPSTLSTETVYATSSVSTAVSAALCPVGDFALGGGGYENDSDPHLAEVGPTVDPTLTTALSTSGSTTTLHFSALVSAMSSGDSIVITSGTHTQTFTTSAAAAIGATSVSVTSQTANFAYPTGSDVNDTTHVAESAPPTSGSGTATGESQGFYAKNTDGSAETAYVICGPSTLSTETAYATSSVSTAVSAALCPVGDFALGGGGYDSSTNAHTGEVGPTVDPTLTTALSTSGSTTTLHFSALVSAMSSGDSIVITSGTHTQTFTTSAAAAIGATSVSVTSQTANFAYPTGSDVNDTTHVAESAPPTSGSGTATGESQGFYATNDDSLAETAYVICAS